MCVCSYLTAPTLHYTTKTTTDTWYLWRLFGWTAPLACYAFFLVAVACNALLVRPLIPLVYIQARPFSFCSGSVSTFISHNRLTLTHACYPNNIYHRSGARATSGTCTPASGTSWRPSRSTGACPSRAGGRTRHVYNLYIYNHVSTIQSH